MGPTSRPARAWTCQTIANGLYGLARSVGTATLRRFTPTAAIHYLETHTIFKITPFNLHAKQQTPTPPELNSRGY
jgi:hypothetical protein